MRRLAAIAIVCAFFAAGFTSCDPGPKFTCATPTKLQGYQGTLHYPPYVVQQDVWTGQGQQTMYVCGPANWKAVANQSGAPETGVKTYPDSQKTYTDWQFCSSQPTIGSFSKLSSTFRHVAPAAGSWDYAYDLFLNGSLCGKPTIEVMVWTQYRGVSVPTAQLHPTIAGTAYDLYHSGGYYQFRMHTQRSGGTVDLLAVLRYLQTNGFLTASDTLQFAAYGPEILTTNGQDLPFWLTGFSVNDARSG